MSLLIFFHPIFQRKPSLTLFLVAFLRSKQVHQFPSVNFLHSLRKKILRSYSLDAIPVTDPTESKALKKLLALAPTSGHTEHHRKSLTVLILSSSITVLPDRRGTAPITPTLWCKNNERNTHTHTQLLYSPFCVFSALTLLVGGGTGRASGL